MLSYTVWCEAGGVGKSTLAANLAVAHARAGLDVLLIPLDPQDADLSRLIGVDDQRKNTEIDTLVHHMVNSPRGPFQDLIRTFEGVDVIPEHNNVGDLDDHLDREKDKAEDLGEAFNIYGALLDVLQSNDVRSDYDVVISDPSRNESIQLYNALYATRNLVIPVEPSAKGEGSVEGLESLASNFSQQLGIEVGVLAAIPNEVKDTNDQREVLDRISYPTPAVIGDRTALFEGCWKEQCSAWTYVRDHRRQKRDWEMDTLRQLDELARFLEAQAGVEAPSPPEAGALEEAA